MKNFTFAVAVNNREVLQKNLYLSPGLLRNGKNQVVIKENYPSASLAYNSAIDEAQNDIIIFIHQDVYLPETWFSDLSQCLAYLEEKRINWGVLGCFGSGKTAGAGLGRVYTVGLGLHGRKITEPKVVETLDEIILIIRKSSGLRFDPYLPHFHLYGADLCMSAKDNGMDNFAFQGLCVHNTNQLLALPKEYYDCYWYIKRKWAKFLPIYTSCLTISRFDKELHQKKIEELRDKAFRIKREPMLRINDPRTIFRNEVEKEVFG